MKIGDRVLIKRSVRDCLIGETAIITFIDGCDDLHLQFAHNYGGVIRNSRLNRIFPKRNIELLYKTKDTSLKEYVNALNTSR